MIIYCYSEVKNLNKIIICRVESVLEVNNLLVEFNTVFCPPLDERIADLKSYAEKLINYGYVYTAIKENKIIGFVSFYANDCKSKVGYLSQIAVKFDCNTKGVGYQLIQQFERTCLEKGMKTLKLEVLNNNKHAVDFYTQNGYKYFCKATELSCYMAKKIFITETK